MLDLLLQGGIAPILAVIGAVLLAVSAAVILARGAEDKDLESRVQSVLRPVGAGPQAISGATTRAAAPF
ncbi:MAG: hypothetical protein ACK40O_13930, partial [Allosphingosinicella sp.]